MNKLLEKYTCSICKLQFSQYVVELLEKASEIKEADSKGSCLLRLFTSDEISDYELLIKKCKAGNE